MQKNRGSSCISIKSPEALNRVILQEEFSKFGKVKKIYIPNQQTTIGKVYLDPESAIKKACMQLNGLNNWTLQEGDFIQIAESNKSVSSSLSDNSKMEEMEEDFFPLSGYVDINGKSVDALQSLQGETYVRLKDVRRTGFNIYPADKFADFIIPRSVDLNHFENFLLDQGRSYVFKNKKEFSEEEMLQRFERVRAKFHTERRESPGQRNNSSRHSNSNVKTHENSVVIDCSGHNNRGSELLTKSRNFPPTAKQSNFRYSEPTVPSQDSTIAPVSRKSEEPIIRTPQQFTINKQIKNDEPSTSEIFNGHRKLLSNNDADTSEPIPLINSKFIQEKTMPVQEVSTIEAEDSCYTGKSLNAALENISLVECKKNDVTEQRKEISPTKVAIPENGSISKPESLTFVDCKKSTSTEQSQETLPANTASSENVNNIKKYNSDFTIKREMLEIGEDYQVSVSYVTEDEGVFYAVLESQLDAQDAICVDLLELYAIMPEIVKPISNLLCSVLHEDLWYRGLIKKITSSGNVIAELIDYGNLEVITETVREIPKQLKEIPAKSSRFKLQPNGLHKKLNIDDKLLITITKYDKDAGYDIKLKAPTKSVTTKDKVAQSKIINESPEKLITKQQRCFTKVHSSLIKLNGGDMVMILSYRENKIILRNRELAGKSKKIYEHIGSMQLDAVTNPVVGQLVLCTKMSNGGLHRAVIQKIQNDKAQVEFVDFFESESVDLSSLKNFDVTLEEYPRTAIEQEYPVLSEIDEEGQKLLSMYIIEKKKFIAELTNDKFEILIPTENNKTEKLSDKITGSKAIKKDSNIYINALKASETQKGVGVYTCCNCTDKNVSIVSMNEKNLEYIDLLENIGPEDDTPYSPEICEMCLVMFREIWCRGVALRLDQPNNQIEVLLVDYGFKKSFGKEEIRRFPKGLTDIPILSVQAEFVGIPNNSRIHERLKELVYDEVVLNIDVKKVNVEEVTCDIEIPDVYATLKEEGLI